jgi:regulator of sigma E protease
VTFLYFLLVIGPLVFLHEMGHYLAARWCGVKADVFSIGFGKEIFGWSDQLGTRWKVGWIPLGGYVKFAGDENASSGPNESWKDLPEGERVHSYLAQPVWKRAIISFAGPFANFVVAFLIYMALYGIFGETRITPVIDKVAPNSAASEAGFQIGDRIKAINGRAIVNFTDIGEYVSMRPKQMMTFDIDRAGQAISITTAPKQEELVSRFGTKATRGMLGIGASEKQREKVQLSVAELPGAAVKQIFRVLRSITDGLGQIIMGYHSVKELGGVIMIAKVANEVASMGWIALIEFIAAISINLGFINLLPVPMLDGGHLLFQSIEALRRKPVALAAQEWAYRFGFVFVMGLMLFVTVNDLVRFGYLGKLGDLIG